MQSHNICFNGQKVIQKSINYIVYARIKYTDLQLVQLKLKPMRIYNFYFFYIKGKISVHN